MYENIQHKEKILLNKRVCNIDLGDDGVRVHTHDGDNFEGSLVIGTDGIHSAVRENMFRIAKKLQPGYFPEDPSSKVPSYYCAIYGVAKDVPGFRDTDVNTCIGYNSSHFSLPGIDGQVFYFVSEKWPKTQYGEDIQRCFTKEEEAEFVKKYAGLKFNETTTFEDIYAHKVVGGMTSLHHTVYEKWSFRRILVIGDSAHKVSDIGTFLPNLVHIDSIGIVLKAGLTIAFEQRSLIHALDKALTRPSSPPLSWSMLS